MVSWNYYVLKFKVSRLRFLSFTQLFTVHNRILVDNIAQNCHRLYGFLDNIFTKKV